jgi:hypothetical protein
VRIVPIPVPEASDSTTKVFLNSGVARIGVVHVALFILVKAFSTIDVQWNAFLLRRYVKGLTIFP